MTPHVHSVPNPTTRERTPDLLKGIAVVLMIHVHVVELFATPETSSSIFGHIALFLGGPPAAPIFMAVMGYFLGATKKTLPQLVRRGMLLIGGGLLLNIGLNLNLLCNIFVGRSALDPWAYILGADILPLAGLSTIIIALIRPIFKRSGMAYLLFASLVATIAGLPPIDITANPIINYILPFIWSESPWSYFPLLPWLTYPLLGYAFTLLYDMIAVEKPPIKYVLLVLCLSCCFASFEYANEITSHLPSYYHHGPIFALWTTLFMIGWLLLASFGERARGNSIAFRYLKWLGRNVTAAYVFQWLLIGNIATEIYRTQNSIRILLWFLLIAGICSGLVYLWEKTKARFHATQPPQQGYAGQPLDRI